MSTYRFTKVTLSILFITCLKPGVCWADAGDLDPTFGDGGLVTTDFLGPNRDFGRDVVAVQPDGKIVVVGSTQSAGGTDFAVARYNSDGSLDTSFGNDGTVTTDFGGFDAATAVAIQADGKIVVAGASNQGATSFDFALARYNYDGTLDSSFGSGGLVTTDFGYTYDLAWAVAIQADGKIVVAGQSYTPPNDFALARYDTYGNLDGTFGSGGLITTDIGGSSDVAFAVAIQEDDGKIVAAGFSVQPGAGQDFALARYNYDGTLDTSFGSAGTGLVTTHFGYSHDIAFGVVIQEADGKIVVAGYSNQPGTGSDFALARYHTDGNLDGTFGSGGLVTTHFGYGSDQAFDVAIQGNGKIVVAGYSYQGGSTYWDFALARYDTYGNLDGTFGSDGLVTTHFGSSQDYAFGLAIQGDGKIVLAGYTNSGRPTGNDFALARYDTYGSLDAGFGSGGLVTTDFLGSNTDFSWLKVVAIQADGKIVVVGSSRGVAPSDFAIARHNPDGSLDTSFGTDGTVTTDFGGSSNDWAYAVTIQTDGKIVVVGQTRSAAATYLDFALARYNSDGTLDTSFGSAGTGLVTTDFAGSNDGASGVVIQADGKIVVAGWARSAAPTYYDFALARYNPDGSLDSSFGSGGLVTTDFASFTDYAYAVAIQADGKIVLAGGSTQQGIGTDFGLVRYNPDGSLDNTFGIGGLVTTDLGFHNAEASGLVIQPDGKIVVAGSSYGGAPTYNDFALARYDTYGNLDGTFGTGGLVTTDFAFNTDWGYGVALQSDGRIVVAGASIQPGTGYDFAMARYDTNGNLDSTFGSGGLVTTDFAGSYEYASAVAIQADGKIVLAGETYSGPPTGSDLALARYEGVADPDALIELLIVEIQNLVSLGVLNNGQGNSLLVKLQGAIQKLDAEQTDTAINKLEAFINQINAFVEAGILTPAEGETLIDAATLIVQLLLLP